MLSLQFILFVRMKWYFLRVNWSGIPIGTADHTHKYLSTLYCSLSFSHSFSSLLSPPSNSFTLSSVTHPFPIFSPHPSLSPTRPTVVQFPSFWIVDSLPIVPLQHMPSSWSSLTPLLSIKRAFSSQRKKKDKKGRRSSPSPLSISSPLPIQLSSPPTVPSQSVPRFSRRDEQLRTRKYLNHPSTPSTSQSIISPTVPRRSQSPSPLIPRRAITPTQQWPSPSTLLEWMEPSLKKNGEEGRRVRTFSEGNLTPSRSSFYSSESIPLPMRVMSKEEIDGRGRGTTERVAAWIRSKSRERVDRVDHEEWKRTSSDRWRKRYCIHSLSLVFLFLSVFIFSYSPSFIVVIVLITSYRVPTVSSRSRSIDNLSYSMPAAAGCTACMTKYSLLNREVTHYLSDREKKERMAPVSFYSVSCSMDDSLTVDRNFKGNDTLIEERCYSHLICL